MVVKFIFDVWEDEIVPTLLDLATPSLCGRCRAGEQWSRADNRWNGRIVNSHRLSVRMLL